MNYHGHDLGANHRFPFDWTELAEIAGAFLIAMLILLAMLG